MVLVEMIKCVREGKDRSTGVGYVGQNNEHCEKIR